MSERKHQAGQTLGASFHEIVFNSSEGQRHLATPASLAVPCQLSVIIPAFNEANRLPQFLDAVKYYLDEEFQDQYEVLVVDDGSTDSQQESVRSKATGWPQLRYLQHSRNQGKGAAVRTGMLNATGLYHLFADADGATPIREEKRLRERILDGADCAAGSRMITKYGAARTRSCFRFISGHVFSLLARSVVGLTVADSQCGFKMFRADASRRLFGMCQESGYIFDVQILGLAERLGMRVDEVGVDWSEIPGSKVRVFRDGLRMLSGLYRIRKELDRIIPEKIVAAAGSDAECPAISACSPDDHVDRE